jgi:uncharacterized membrane-anchored protein YitT (DUF2179 family)
VDGMATVLQALTGVNAGFFTVAINLPLLIAAWFILKRRYVYYTLLYTVLLAFFLILLAKIDFYAYEPRGERLLPAVFGGMAHGLTGIMLRLGASSGGVDVMAGMIQKKHAHRDVEKIISWISFATVAVSYLVYRNFESVLLSIVEIIVCERITALILRTTRTSIRCEIVTSSPDAVRAALTEKLSSDGGFVSVQMVRTEDSNGVLLCVICRRQLPELLRILRQFPNTVIYYSDVMGVINGEK